MSLSSSHSNYGLLLWGAKSYKVEIMQKKAIRPATNSSYFAHTTPLFIKLNLLNIPDMFKLKLLIFFHKLSFDPLPPFSNTYLDTVMQEPACTLRQNLIHPPFGKRDYTECSPLIQLLAMVNKVKADKNDTILAVIVDHRILLRKLYAYGIRGALLKWFESYLTGRTQYVAFNGTNSDIHYVKCGVPRSSILGPLLFILYMNDMCGVSKLLFTLLYADDTCVMLSGKDLNDLIAVLNVELISLSDWLKSNKLSFNTQKFFFIVFHRARIKKNCNDLVIDNAFITRVYSAKYLGIIIDVKFNWIEHITYIKNKISKAIGIMYKARQYLNKSLLVNLLLLICLSLLNLLY